MGVRSSLIQIKQMKTQEPRNRRTPKASAGIKYGGLMRPVEEPATVMAKA